MSFFLLLLAKQRNSSYNLKSRDMSNFRYFAFDSMFAFLLKLFIFNVNVHILLMCL